MYKLVYDVINNMQVLAMSIKEIKVYIRIFLLNYFRHRLGYTPGISEVHGRRQQPTIRWTVQYNKNTAQ